MDNTGRHALVLWETPLLQGAQRRSNRARAHWLWIALLTLAMTTAVQPPALAQGNRALGEYLSSACVSCHPVGRKPADGIPDIVGWPSDQFIAVLQAYKDRTREHQIMNSVATGLSEADIAALAEYFGHLSRN